MVVGRGVHSRTRHEEVRMDRVERGLEVDLPPLTKMSPIRGSCRRGINWLSVDSSHHVRRNTADFYLRNYTCIASFLNLLMRVEERQQAKREAALLRIKHDSHRETLCEYGTLQEET